jgi:hypothetical protein
MKAKSIMSYLSDVFPFRRKSSLDWIVPVSIGLGVGIAAGVGVGILVAPSSGEHTRARLRDRAERMKERARMAAQRAGGRLAEGYEEPAGERSFVGDVGSR